MTTVRFKGCDPEYMGVFGFTWQEKVGKKMLSLLDGTGYESSIKSFWGGSGLNTGMINDLHDSYVSLLTAGNRPAEYTGSIPSIQTTSLSRTIQGSTAIAEPIVDAFLFSLYNLASIGKISYSIYDPVGYKKVAETVTETEPVTGVQAVIQDTGKTVGKILIVAGLAAGAVLFVNINKMFKE